MTRKEALQLQAMEECAEVAHRISKLMRFGADETEPGQDQERTNLQRVHDEFTDLAVTMLRAGLLPIAEGETSVVFDADHMRNKHDKIDRYLAYSERLGIVKGD